MSSECYWCVSGKQAYGNQIGTMGYPFACCHRCKVFVCGHHGQRDDDIQQFFCFDCDKSILIASAVSIAHPNEAEYISLLKGLGKVFESIFREVLFTSFVDFKNRRKGYQFFFDQIFDSYIDYDNWADRETKDLFKNFPKDSQMLLVAAAILVSDTDNLEELENRNNKIFLSLKSCLRMPIYG